MKTGIERIRTPEDLARCVEESAGRPVILLKHSTT
jgi:hypothetical protein